MEKISNDIILGLLKQKKIGIDPIHVSAEDVRARLAYNKALDDVKEFMDYYSEGHIDREFTNTLIKLAQEK